MRTSLRWVPLLVAAGFLSGCQLGAAYLAAEFSLSVEPQELTVARGGSAEAVVGVGRPLGLDVSPLPVFVSLHRPPEGITIGEGEQIQVPSGVNEETITLEVAADAELGEHELVLRGTNTVRTKETTLTLTVVGAP